MFFSFLQKKYTKNIQKTKYIFRRSILRRTCPPSVLEPRRHSAAGTAHRLGFSPEKKNWSIKPIRKNSLSTVFYTLPRAQPGSIGCTTQLFQQKMALGCMKQPYEIQARPPVPHITIHFCMMTGCKHRPYFLHVLSNICEIT